VAHIVLVGLMGSGKTTVGAALAAALDVPLRDSDADIERGSGLRGRDIAERDGIEALHALEARHLLDALEAPSRSVIAAAASTVDDPVCRAALRDGPHLVVWLTADPDVLAARLGPDDHRPDLGADLVQLIRRQSAQRGGWLRDVADLALDAGQPPATLVATILARTDAVR